MDQIGDWTLMQSFLAVAEEGSLSGAARRLGLTQPTLGRHIAALEARLKIDLFTRAPRGLRPSAAAMDLLPHIRAMQAAALAASLAAAGRAQRLAGPVRLTASKVVAHYLLPPLLADLRAKAPQIEIDLIASDASDNLLFREADIALRMYRPNQLDLVARHLTDVPMALFAAKTYIAARGMPVDLAALRAHDLIGFDKSELMLRMMHALGLGMQRDDFKLRCDDQLVYWQLVRAGAGIGGMQLGIGRADPDVVQVAPFVALPSLPLWITAPQTLLAAPRMRFVFDHLAAGLAPLFHPRSPSPA